MTASGREPQTFGFFALGNHSLPRKIEGARFVIILRLY